MTGLSFDIGKNTGIALWSDWELVKVEPVGFPYPYFGQVLTEFRNYMLNEGFGYGKLSWVAYEEVAPRNKYHSELHFGMVGWLAMQCYEWQIPLIGVNTKTAKKLTTGNGNATKDEMVAEIHRRYPHIPDLTHDMADAVAVGLVALSQMEPHS